MEKPKTRKQTKPLIKLILKIKNKNQQVGWKAVITSDTGGQYALNNWLLTHFKIQFARNMLLELIQDEIESQNKTVTLRILNH